MNDIADNGYYYLERRDKVRDTRLRTRPTSPLSARSFSPKPIPNDHRSRVFSQVCIDTTRQISGSVMCLTDGSRYDKAKDGEVSADAQIRRKFIVEICIHNVRTEELRSLKQTLSTHRDLPPYYI